MVNQKTTAVRVIPAVGKEVGDRVEFGGLLGYAPIMPVSPFGCSAFVNRGGRISAPLPPCIPPSRIANPQNWKVSLVMSSA